MLLEERELLVVGRVVGHDPVLGAVVHKLFAPDVLDDRGVAAGVLDRQVYVGLVAVRPHHHHLDGVEQCKGFLAGRRVVEQELRP